MHKSIVYAYSSGLINLKTINFVVDMLIYAHMNLYTNIYFS